MIDSEESTLDPFSPLTDDLEKDEEVLGTSLDLDPYQPLADDTEEEESDKLISTALDPFSPLVEDAEEVEEAIDVDTELVPEKGLTAGQQAASLGIDIGGSIGSQVVGAAFLPLYPFIAFGGGVASNLLAQTTAEGRSLDEISWGRLISAGFLNLIPGAASTKLARPIATEALRGAAIGAADVTFQKAIDEKRMPTKEEYLLGLGLGGVFGTAGGAITKKINDAKGLVYGMDYSDIDKLILTKKGEPLRDALEEQGIDWTEDKLKKETAKLHERIALQKTKNADMSITQGWTGTGGVFSNLNPFLVTGDSIRTQAFDFEQRTKKLENFQQRLPKDIREGLDGLKDNKLMREFGADIDSYLDGNEMTQRLSEQPWSASLQKFRLMENDFYEDLLSVLSSEDRYDNMFADLNANERAFFREKIERARQDRGYRARQYKALIPGAKEQGTDRIYTLNDIDTLKKKPSDERGVTAYQALFNEIKEHQIKRNPLVITKEAKDELRKELADADGKLSAENKAILDEKITVEQLVGQDGESGLIQKHMENLISRNQSKAKKTVLKNTLPGNVEMILKNHIPGELESRWLGEVTDVGFRMKQGMFNVGMQLAKFNSNKLVARNLADANLISTKPEGEFQTEIKVFGELKGSFFTTKEVAGALDQIFGNKFLMQTENEILKNAAGIWKRSEAMSKAVKVLFNPPSYFVNLWSANFSMLGMGMLPSPENISKFKTGFGKGLRQSRFLEKVINNVQKPNAQERLRILNELDELQSLGVLDADTASLFADDITQGMRTGKNQVSQMIQGTTEFVGKIYSLSDVAARLSVFEHNKKILGKIFPDVAVNQSDVFKRMAAELTNDTYQNYARVSRIIRTASKFGVMPQFVTFTAELTRNVFNQYKVATQMVRGTFGSQYGLSAKDISAANLEAMRGEGLKRLAFLSGLIGLSSYGLEAINRNNGVTEEQEDYYRSIFPQYLRNKNLIFKVDKDNPNNVAVANASYIVPQAVVGSAVQALFAGKTSERDMITLLMDEFMGEGTFFAKEIYRSIDNRDKYGEKITRATELNEQMYDIFSYIFKEAFETGAQRELQKFAQAREGKGLYTTTEVWFRQFGARFQKLEVDKYVRFKLQDLADAQSEYKGDYTKAKKYEIVEGRINEQELEERYQINNERSRAVYDEILKTYKNSVSSSGLTKDQVDEIFTGSRSNLSSKNKIAILSGLPYADMPRELVMTQQEQYDTMFGLDTDIGNYSDFEIRRQINSFRRDDPNRYRAFTRIYKNSKRADAQKNLTTVQKLLKKLSVYDRAIMLKDLGLDSREELNKLRRLGIYTDQVKQTMRALEQ